MNSILYLVITIFLFPYYMYDILFRYDDFSFRTYNFYYLDLRIYYPVITTFHVLSLTLLDFRTFECSLPPFLTKHFKQLIYLSQLNKVSIGCILRLTAIFYLIKTCRKVEISCTTHASLMNLVC